MSIPNVARQYPLSVFIDIVFGDIPLHATAYALCAVPQGSVFTQMKAYVTTAFASAGTMDADFGDATDPDEYSGTIVEIDATGIPSNPPIVSGFKTTASEPDLLLTPTFGTTTTSPTVGAMRLLVTYITSGRNNENLG